MKNNWRHLFEDSITLQVCQQNNIYCVYVAKHRFSKMFSKKIAELKDDHRTIYSLFNKIEFFKY